MHAVADWLHGNGQCKSVIEERDTVFCPGLGLIKIGGQPVARGARRGDEVGTCLGEVVGGPMAAWAEWLHEETQDPGNRPDRKIGDNLVEASLDGGEARLHAPSQKWQVI